MSGDLRLKGVRKVVHSYAPTLVKQVPSNTAVYRHNFLRGRSWIQTAYKFV